MDRLTELLEITFKLLAVKAMDVINPVYKLLEYASGYFAVRFAIGIMVLFVLLRAAEKALEYYALHNFVHKKMLVPSAHSAEYKLFLSNLWDLETSKGIIDNAKAAKTRLLAYNKEELTQILHYLKTRRRTSSRSFLFTISFSFLAGVLLTYVSEWNLIGALNAEFFLKVALYTAFWFAMLEFSQRNRQHQVMALIYSVNETLKVLQENPHVVAYDRVEENNSYAGRSSQLFDT